MLSLELIRAPANENAVCALVPPTTGKPWQFLKAEKSRRNSVILTGKYNKEYCLHVARLFCMHVEAYFSVWRRAEIAFGLVLYRVPCQCRALAWPFIVINRKVCSAELE